MFKVGNTSTLKMDFSCILRCTQTILFFLPKRVLPKRVLVEELEMFKKYYGRRDFQKFFVWGNLISKSWFNFSLEVCRSQDDFDMVVWSKAF